MRIQMNLNSLECCVCEGIFSSGEKVIEEDNKLYCEACYEETNENVKQGGNDMTKFVCPKCNTEWERSPHYDAIVRNQNMIFIMSGNPKLISDLCGKCNHMVDKKGEDIID